MVVTFVVVVVVTFVVVVVVTFVVVVALMFVVVVALMFVGIVRECDFACNERLVAMLVPYVCAIWTVYLVNL